MPVNNRLKSLMLLMGVAVSLPLLSAAASLAGQPTVTAPDSLAAVRTEAPVIASDSLAAVKPEAPVIAADSLAVVRTEAPVIASDSLAAVRTEAPVSPKEVPVSVSKIEHEEHAESFFPQRARSLEESHFSWGAEFGTSIDVSGYDSSTFNVDALFGYKNKYLRLLGMGVGIHRSFGTGDNFVPVYAVVRTSFSSRPKLFFMSFKAGYSFNTISNSSTFGDVNASLGAGINLAVSRKFRTHIILGYEFRHFNQKHREKYSLEAEDISLATLSLGVNF